MERTFAIFYVVVLLCLMGISLFVGSNIVQKSEYEILSLNELYTVGYIMLTVGVISIFAIIGELIHLKVKKKAFLYGFGVLLFFIFLLSLIASTMYIKNRRSIIHSINETILNAVEKYVDNKLMVDSLQQAVECCGAISYSEYMPHLPNSCCITPPCEYSNVFDKVGLFVTPRGASSRSTWKSAITEYTSSW